MSKILLDRDFLKELVLKVSLQFENKVGIEYFNTSQKRIKHLIGFTKVCILLIENKLTYQVVDSIINKLKSYRLNKEEIEKSLKIMNELLISFCKEKNIKLNKSKLKEFNHMCLKHFDNNNLLFEIESEKRDENIENMHYKDEEKISAREFLENESIDIGIIDEIGDILEEYYVINFDEINEDYIKHLMRIINEFIHIFNYSFEFKDLAYGLESFLKFLNQYDLSAHENKELIKLLIDSIIDDLNKFYYSVFINRDAVDIHYLDASLLANIAQIEIILNQTKGD